MFTFNMVDLLAYGQPNHVTQNQPDGSKSFQNELNFDRLQTPFTPLVGFSSPAVDAMSKTCGYHNMRPDTDLTSVSIAAALQSLTYNEKINGGDNAQTVWTGIDWGVVR